MELLNLTEMIVKVVLHQFTAGDVVFLQVRKEE